MSEKKKANAELSDADLDRVTGGTGSGSTEEDPYRIQLLQDIANERCSFDMKQHVVDERGMSGQLYCKKCGKTWD